MSERTTVVNAGGGTSGVAILAIVLVAILVIAAFLWFGGGRALFPSQINVDVNQPNNPPAQPQQPPQQPAPQNPMSYRLVLPEPTG